MQSLHKAACRGAAKLIENKAAAQGVGLTPSDLNALARYLEDPTKTQPKLNPIVEDGRRNVTMDVSDIDVNSLTDRIIATIPDLLHSEPRNIAEDLLPRLKSNWAAHAGRER